MATDAEIRTAQGELIKTAYPTAKVWCWNALSHDLADWPGMFTLDDGSIHGWIIKRAGGSAVWKGSGNRDRQTLRYDVMGFYGPLRPGSEGDNSDDEFSVIVDTVYAAFKAAPKLGLDCIEEHDLLQWQQITTINCGEVVLHLAVGRLDVPHCC